MPAASQIEGSEIVADDGTPLGRVDHVLFDPSEPFAVALMVRRDRALGVVSRAPAFVAWADAEFGEGRVTMRGGRLPSRRAAEAALGVDPDATVIWRGMPVADSSGKAFGSVGDVSLDEEGRVTVMSVSAGPVGDFAHGRIQVAGELVRGFDGRAVVVDAREEDLDVGGGLAASAGRKAATVKAAASGAAKSAEDVLEGASYAAGKALGKAARSKTAARARGALKGIGAAYREGRGEKRDAK